MACGVGAVGTMGEGRVMLIDQVEAMTLLRETLRVLAPLCPAQEDEDKLYGIVLMSDMKRAKQLAVKIRETLDKAVNDNLR